MGYASKRSNGLNSSKSSPLFESEVEHLSVILVAPNHCCPYKTWASLFRFVCLLTQPMAAHLECEFALRFLAGETALL